MKKILLIRKKTSTPSVDTTAPLLSGFYVPDANPDRVYFIVNEDWTATTFGGFTFGSGKTATAITKVSSSLGYFTMSASYVYADGNDTVAYSGTGCDLADTNSNALESFTSTTITNSIIDPSLPVDITNWDVTKNAETVTSYAVTASSLGMVENDESEALNNANKLIAGINSNPTGIDVDGVYYIQTPVTSLTSTAIRLSSTNNGELKSNQALTTLFTSQGITDIEIGGVTFSDVYSGGGQLNLFRYDGNSAHSMGILKFNSNFFNGNIYVYKKRSGETTNPSTYGIGEVSIKNNTFSNNRNRAFDIRDIPITTCNIINNEIHNVDNVVFEIAIGNTHTYENDLFTLRPLFTITDNYLHNDLDFECFGLDGAYQGLAVIEANRVDYLRNHVEGIWSKQEVAIYDAYLSCNVVNYKNNVNKNNITFNGYKVAGTNTLMKSKGAQEFPLVSITRDYEFNHFIVEESWIDYLVSIEGVNKAHGWVIYSQTSVDYNNPSSTYIKNNVFDIYSLVGDQGYNINAVNYETSGNTFNLGYSNGIFTETMLLTDSNVPQSVIFSNNVINASIGVNQTETTPAMVKFSDQRTTNTDKVTSIVFNNNSGTLYNYMWFYGYDAEYFEMQNNTFITNVSSISYPLIWKDTYANQTSTLNNSITFNSNNYMIGENQYGAGNDIAENITLIGTPEPNLNQFLELKKGLPSTNETTYRRTHIIDTNVEEWYFEYTLTYDTDHWNVTFINTSDVEVTYRLNNGDAVTDGDNANVKIYNTTATTATTLRFNNDDGWSGFNYTFGYSNVEMNLSTISTIVTDPYGAELLTNGDFEGTWSASDFGNVPNGWVHTFSGHSATNYIDESLAGGELELVNDTYNASGLKTPNILTIGTNYRLTFDIISHSSIRALRVAQANTVAIQTFNTVGTKEVFFTATGDDIIFMPNDNGAFNCVIDNVSLKEVL